jgi:tetratricopeptide (TPR) repeat protein
MKKIVVLLCVILIGVGNAGAQKKNVAKAKAKILLETPDTNAAKEAILIALKDSTTCNLPLTWFVAGDVFNTIYTEQQKLQWIQKKGDKALMAESLKTAFDYYLKADSLDQKPNAKGKVSPKYRKKITDKLKEFQRGFTDAGSYYYEQKNYKKALTMFDTYLKYRTLPFMKNQGLEKDTLIPLITFYCGLAATQAKEPALSVKYYEQIKDSIADSNWVYTRLCDDYAALKDTANLIRMYQLGAAKFPKEPFYVRNMVNYYIMENKMDDALIWINHAIEQEPNSAILWNVKGRILEIDKKIDNAKDCFNKALEFDPNFADALGNLGRISYNFAVEELNRINTINEDKAYRAEKIKLKTLFEESKPYFEKAHALSPNERDYIIALRGIYYNLNMDAKYQEMEKLLKQSSN